jgi:hypothetical protein
VFCWWVLFWCCFSFPGGNLWLRSTVLLISSPDVNTCSSFWNVPGMYYFVAMWYETLKWFVLLIIHQNNLNRMHSSHIIQIISFILTFKGQNLKFMLSSRITQLFKSNFSDMIHTRSFYICSSFEVFTEVIIRLWLSGLWLLCRYWHMEKHAGSGIRLNRQLAEEVEKVSDYFLTCLFFWSFIIFLHYH